MTRQATTPAAGPSRSRRPVWIAVALLAALAVTVVAVRRGGLLGLPAVPPGVTAGSAGLEHLKELGARARILDSAAGGIMAPADGSGPAVARAAAGLVAIHDGDPQRGLDSLRAGLAQAPDDLVLGNAFRMAVFHLRRQYLGDAAGRVTLAAQVPAWLEHEPFVTLDRLYAQHPCREMALNRALAWSDELVLYGALEIKAPASVESVKLLTALLQSEPTYVPALYGRGLNYVHRPKRLEWPEAKKMAPDAASADVGLSVAIGRHVGGASPQLVATLALTLGDAYAKEGQAERARSWWQIANNSCREPEITEAVRRRLTWQDDQLLDALESELETRMRDTAHPLTDLSMMWR